MRHNGTRRSRGFTLTELLVVILIIGILMSFILVAAVDGVRRAEEKATLGLIAKLEMGLSERIEAVLLRRADIYPAHADMGAIYTSSGLRLPPVPATGTAPPNQRAQIIAQIDLVRSEIPDVFTVEPDPTVAAHYPINFAGIPYGTPFVPLGAPLANDQVFSNQFPPLGASGATWQVMAGITKQLGYLPAGYDGVDNNGDGYIDDLLEGAGGSGTALANQIVNTLRNVHTHKTARSEMLYALLVNGAGPLGSIFSADEFTNREVGDTDGDGLLEFIDAWGEPLQFYRWPIFYNGDYPPGGQALTPTASYIQKGILPYSGLTEPRQTDALDPNQQLVAPAWFSSQSNQPSPTAPFSSFASGPQGSSAGANAFMTYFHTLIDPNFGIVAVGQAWDRSGLFSRRAYYSRPLIVSSGPDKALGIVHFTTTPSPAQLIGSASTQGENNGGQQVLPANAANSPINTDLATNSQDDITNHSLASPGGGTR